MEGKGKLKGMIRVLCIYSILMCSCSIGGHFYLLSTGKTIVVGLFQALFALFGLGLVIITSFLIFTSLRKWRRTGSSETYKRRKKLRILIQVLSIYSVLICSYSIGGNFYLFFTKKAQAMELYGALGALFAFAPVIIMSILAFGYLKEREVHIA